MENNLYKSKNIEKNSVILLDCPHCGANDIHTATIYIDAQEDTKIVKKLLNKKMFEFECNNCKQTQIFEHMFEYVDEENSVRMLCTMNPEFINEFEPRWLSNRTTVYDQKFRFARIVATFPEFIEKYIILTNGLDDRIIEFIKLDIRENRAAECGTIKNVICFHVNDKCICIRAIGEKKMKAFYITFEEYEEFKSKYAHCLNNYKPVIIDASWAIDNAD